MSRLHQSVRTFSLSSARLSSEEGDGRDGNSKLKNEPEVKKLLATIQEDFKTEEPETPKSVKNVSDLLSEIYGEATEADKKEEEKKNKFSSVGNISFSLLSFL